MGISEETLAVAMTYVKNSLAGAGALKGVPCQIQSITPITGGNRITYLWVDNNNVEHTSTLDVYDGERGPQGPQGLQGERGMQGIQGIQGEQGPRGVKGEDGATGPRGPQGLQGNPGANGQAATISVGTVTSGASAGVTNAGTAQNAVFNFVLPKGDKGDKGNDGKDGADGKSFEIKAQFPTEAALRAAHPTGEAGDAYFVGTTDNPDLYVWLTDDQDWFNNGKIAGVKGDKGDTGDDGFSPVASVTKAGGIATITIRDKTGTTTENVYDGVDGTGITSIDFKEEDQDGNYVYTITLDDGNDYDITCPKGSAGQTGATGTGIVSITYKETDSAGNNIYTVSLSDGTSYDITCPRGPQGSPIQSDWSQTDPTAYDYIKDKPVLGDAAGKNFTTYVSPNNPDLPISGSVYAAITSATYGAYHPSGSKTIAQLTADLLVKANVGNVYKITEDGETTNLFIGGAGQTIHTGDNAVVVYAGTDPESFLYDLQSGSIDLTPYQTKDLTQAIEGATTVEGALGALSTNKTDKVSSATAGDIATLDANGNLVDSGYNKSLLIDNTNGAVKAISTYASAAQLNITDANDIKFADAMIYCNSSVSHLPTADYYNIKVFSINNDSTVYEQIAFRSSTPVEIYTRRYTSSVGWTSWEKLVTESDLTYSTSETNTGKTWIDGKPIYRKVIHYAGVATSGTSTLIGSITGFADIISIEGTLRNSTDDNCFPLGYTYSNFGSTVIQNMPFVIGNNGSVYANPYGFNISNINVTIEYTKTTD